MVSLVKWQLVCAKWHWSPVPNCQVGQKEGPWVFQLPKYTCSFFWDSHIYTDKRPHKAHKGQPWQSRDEQSASWNGAYSSFPSPASPSQQRTLSYPDLKGKVNTLSCAPQLYLFAPGCLPWSIRDVSKAYLFSLCPLLANLTAVLIRARKLCQSAGELRKLRWVFQHYTSCMQQVQGVSRALGTLGEGPDNVGLSV